MNKEPKKYFKKIHFGENRARLKLLIKFRELVREYFDNSTLNMLKGNYTEKEEAREAKTAIVQLIKKVYNTIRLADIKTSAISTSSIAIGIKGQNIDLILNIFNLGRNNIPPEAAIDFIDEAIEVYKSNRLRSFIRTISPFFWIEVILSNIVERSGEKNLPS